MRLRRIDGGVRRVETIELSTEELINEGIYPEAGYVGSLEARVDMLTRLVAYLLDRQGLTTKELIELTRNEFRFEEDD